MSYSDWQTRDPFDVDARYESDRPEPEIWCEECGEYIADTRNDRPYRLNGETFCGRCAEKCPKCDEAMDDDHECEAEDEPCSIAITNAVKIAASSSKTANVA